MVKARFVRLAGKGFAAARAHLRYVQRDGVTREGTAGELYSASADRADGRDFLERSRDDRHQFRFIVSAEDGAEYDDLRPLIRRVMQKMEQDLGTRLEWVAVDHCDTEHPHTHVILRGKDERGENLVIARDYLSRGLRERVAGQVALDLGPRSDLEIRARLRREVEAQRLTSIDRRLLREMDSRRELRAGGRDMFHHSLRAGRLRKLGALGLAEPLGDGRWRLADELEASLRTLGERGDIIRTMHKALSAHGLSRAGADLVSGSLPGDQPVVGRLIARGLSDEARDRHYLIIDAVDGRTRHVDIGRADGIEPLPEGAIVRLSKAQAEVRASDRAVAAIAARTGGRYSEDIHLGLEPDKTAAHVRAHVRRLEALRRRLGEPQRRDDGVWQVGDDHLGRARRYEAARARDAPVRVELLSALPLEALPSAEAATWLDRELVADAPQALRESGFGGEVRRARAARQAWLVQQGLAEADGGRLVCRRDMLALLRQREFMRLSERLAGEFGLPAREAEQGEQVSGVLRRRVDLASGRYALLAGSSELILVPWRPDLERQLGRQLSGRVGPSGLNWSRGRVRGIEIG